MEWRKKYSEWALKELKEEVIFIFIDENYHNFGGEPYKKQRITRMKREPADLRADQVPKLQFSIIQSRACCVDIKVETTIYIWEIETSQQKKSTKNVLEEEDKELLEKTLQKHKKALKTETEKYHLLAEMNANIQKHNDDWRQERH